MAGGFLPPVIAVLGANISEFSAKMGEARAEMAETEGSTAGLKTISLGLAAAVIGIGVESVKMATDFQAQMELLHTQAGVAQSAVGSLSNGVLELAGQVGFAPTSLAEALFHIESSFASVGITGPTALNLLKVAAEGAAVGHANLVDVTNALDSAVVSGIPGVQNFTQAMGTLNATVGAGDMTMQDLANAFSTGLLATVKGFGLSITDVGAALATFGDNNIRGTVAATDLRMAVQAMAKPAATAGGELTKLGLNTNTLSKDMQSGGLLKALTDLKDRMDKAGISAKQQGQVITDLFGKKAGTGLNVLIDQLDRVKSKYPDLTKGANQFGDAWAATQQNFSQQLKQIEATVQSLAIKLGTVLLPPLTKFLEWVQKGIGWLEHHRAALYVLAGVIAGGLVSALYAAVAATIAWTAALDVNPIFLAITAIGALVGGIIYAYQHFKSFRDIVDAVGRFFKSVWQDVMHAAGAVIQWFINGPLVWIKARLAEFQAFWKAHGQQIIEIAKKAWTVISTEIKIAWDIIQAEFKVAVTVVKAIWTFLWDYVKNYVKTVWDLVKNVIETGWHFVLNLFSLFADLLTGHWSKLWGDVKKLLGQAIGDIGKTIGNFAKDALNLLYQAGKDIITGLINGVKSMGSAAWSAVKSIGSDIKHGFTSLFGIGSPSRVFHEYGQNIGQGLVNGITSMHSSAADAVKGLGSAALSGWHGAGTQGLGALPVAGGAASMLVINVNAGTVLYDERQFADAVTQALTRWGMRVPNQNTSFQSNRGLKNA